MAVRERRSNRVRSFLAKALLGTPIGHAAACWTISRWLTRRAPARIRQTPSQYGFQWLPLECRSEDGLKLFGWVVEPREPCGTVVLFHGLRQSRQRMLPRLAMLVRAGFRCVSFDHRAHGKSKGKRTSFGYHEAKDVVAIRELVRRRWPDDAVTAFGLSMGAAALCYASDRVNDWSAVVLEGIYSDLGNAFLRRIGATYPAWFANLFPGIIQMTERRMRLRIEQLVPTKYVNGFGGIPLLLVVGELDYLAPRSDSEAIKACYKGPVDLWCVPGAGHSDCADVGGDEYAERLVRFFGKQT